jgi:hypothetical protein
MGNRLSLAVAAGVLAASFSAGVHAADDNVTITTFELTDGTKLETFRFSAAGNGDLKNYIITAMDGRKQILLEREIVRRTDASVALDKLPAAGREEVLRSRAALAAARAESEAVAADQQIIDAARAKEIDVRNTLKKIGDETALARTVLTGAETLVRNAPSDIAKADARYDAAKTELASAGNCSHCAFGACTLNHRSADVLTEIMTAAAEDKVKIEQARKEAEGVVTRTLDNIKQLNARYDALRKAYDSAHKDTQAAIQKARDAANQRRKDRQAKLEGEAKATVTEITLKDKSIIRAVMLLQDAEGRLSIKDDQGKVHYVEPEQIAKRETKPAK